MEAQKQQLIQNGILEKNILVEIGSAANEIKNRPIFQILRNEKLQKGDSLMVTKILLKRKIEFISLDLRYSDDPGINRLIATTLSSIAEFENNRRKERQAQGIQEGRKTVITGIEKAFRLMSLLILSNLMRVVKLI